MKNNKSSSLEKTIQRLFGAVLILFLGFTYGYFTHSRKIFPYQIISEARKGFTQFKKRTKWFYRKTDKIQAVITSSGEPSKGLTLISYVDVDSKLAVKVIDIKGTMVHKWVIDWFELWPEAAHIPEERIPKSPPGTHIHGAVFMDNGDLVFNFEQLGLVRMDLCGKVVWKLPFTTHHSVHKDEEDYLWVCGGKVRRDKNGKVEHLPFYIEELVLKVSPSGEILKEISIQEILERNNLQGLLHMSILMGREQTTTGDLLHNNDVEPFPQEMDPGYFEQGDIMISMRNINTVLVFRESDLKVKALSVGEVVKQHDPDFIDGNTISIFDNNMIESVNTRPQSRIVVRSFIGDQEISTYYSGTEAQPFYTAQMGKHQWLPNGNLLITSPFEAKAFEIDSVGNRVWEYTNLLGNGYTGLMEEAQRLPASFTKEFFIKGAEACSP